MPDNKGNLYLFEAIELRKEYDRHIKLIESLLESDESKQNRFLSDREEEKEPVDEYKPQETEKMLKKLQTKRVKLNQAIQVANFKYQIQFDGEKISIAEALEIRKRIIDDLSADSRRVVNSAFKRIIHKEERDIVHVPKQNYTESYAQYSENLKKLRDLIIQIHKTNYKGVVNFREE